MSNHKSDNSRKVVLLPDSKQLERDAAQWVAVMGNEGVSDADIERFDRWCALSERHRNAFERAQALMTEMSILSELDDIAESSIDYLERDPSNIGRRQFIAATAASVAIAVPIGMYFFRQRGELLDQGDYTTEVGQQKTVTLSDGSLALLNTNTVIRVSYSRDERRLQLLQGEAHFDVAKDRARPFVVFAADHAVEAIGTSFAVHLRKDNSVEVTVEEGRIALSTTDQPPSENSSANIVDKIDNDLVAGQNIVITEQFETITEIESTELQRKLSWRKGVLDYAGESLEEVINDISRYTDVRIEITDPAVRQRPIGGIYRVGEVEKLFDALHLTFGLHVEYVTDSHVRISVPG